MKRFSLLALLLLLAGCGDNRHAWLGYAEGDTAFVAAPQAGWVARMNVSRGAEVVRGETLFTLDDTHESATRDEALAAIAQADGQIVEARATLEFAQKEYRRQTGLLRSGATSKQAFDQAKSNYDQAVAKANQILAGKAQAQATLRDASYRLSERDIVSRTHGQVQDVFFREGEYAPAMTPIVSVLPPENIYVRFFVPESEFAQVKLGQKVSISCDGCAANMTATVTFIASREEFTPPVIFSIDNRTKLSFKIEARAPGGLKLHPGQPVDVHPLP